MKSLVMVAAIALLAVACGDLDYQSRVMTAPSGPNSLWAWSKAVGLHTPGGAAIPIQMAVVRRLAKAGNLEWVRLGADVGGDSADLAYNLECKALGLHVVHVLQLSDLQQYGWTEAFDIVYAKYPHDSEDVWGIAGEVTNNNPNVNPTGTITPEYYLTKFRELYEYVKLRHPEVTLSNGPTLGSGGGPSELQWYFDHGLLDMDIVISVNDYSDHATMQYGALFQNEKYRDKLVGKRIFVTETSDCRGRQYHIHHVEEFYPRIRAYINPERIFWYQLWGGDGPPDNGCGLISGVETGQYEEGPLVRALTIEKVGQ